MFYLMFCLYTIVILEINLSYLIRNSDELIKGALRGLTTCSDPVGIVDWGYLILESQHNLRIKTLNKGNTYLS